MIHRYFITYPAISIAFLTFLVVVSALFNFAESQCFGQGTSIIEQEFVSKGIQVEKGGVFKFPIDYELARELETIHHFADIKKVVCQQCSNVDKALERFENTHSLEHLDLARSDLSFGISKIERCRKLKYLDVSGTRLFTFSFLSPLVNLESLHIKHTSFGNGDCKFLMALKKLEFLSLQDTEFTGSGLAELAKLPRLKVLYLQRTNISDQEAGEILKFPSLEFVNLPSTISKTKLEEMQSKSNIKIVCGPHAKRKFDVTLLNAENTLVTAKFTLEELFESEFPGRFKSIDMQRSRVNDAAVFRLARFKNLKKLNLSHTWVTDAAITQLAKFKNLESLDISDTRISSVGFEKACGDRAVFQKLNTLIVRNTGVSGIGINSDILPKLERVDISRFGQNRWHRTELIPCISNEGIRVLLKANRLSEIKLTWRDDLEKELVFQLLGMTPELEKLTIYGTKFTQEEVARIKNEAGNSSLAIEFVSFE